MFDPHPWHDPETDELVVDYCIIGGGLGGLYSAVRLAETDGTKEPPRICILEATSRIGGRMVTVRMPGSSLHADIGAMRYIPKQPLMSSLVEHYGLETYEHDFPTDFYFVRGRRLRPRDGRLQPATTTSQLESSAPLYHSLRPEEIDKEPAALALHGIAKVLQKVVVPEPVSSDSEQRLVNVKDLNKKLRKCYESVIFDRFQAFSPKEWRTIKLLGKYPNENGLNLYQLGFWDVIQSQLSSEAYSFVDEGLGYQTIIGTWNAADAIPWFLADFAGVPYRSIRGGMGQIPIQLHKTFVEAMTQRTELRPFSEDLVVFQSTKVKKVVWREGTRDVLIHAEIPVQGSLGASAPVRLRASHCLVCVSKGACERMQFVTIGADSRELDLKRRSVMRAVVPHSAESSEPSIRDRDGMLGRIVGAYPDDASRYTLSWILDCVERQPLLKMFLAFSLAWWEPMWQRTNERSEQNQGFKVFTNLPLRQLYYHFAPRPSGGAVSPGRASTEGHEGMVMAYCDAKHAAYWDALKFQDGMRYGGETVTDLKQLRDLQEFGVSRHLAERAHEQIWRIHQGLFQEGDVPLADTEVSDFVPENERGEKERIARSKTVLFMNWMRPPFYGGWHAWRINVVSDDVKRIWECPWIGVPIYFAGEVMSSDQGWGEGALRSAERVLMRQLRLAAPRWEMGTGAGRREVGTSKKAQDLGFEGIEDYVVW